jgi:hypothetical protein
MKNLNRYYMAQFKLDLTGYRGELGLYSAAQFLEKGITTFSSL